MTLMTLLNHPVTLDLVERQPFDPVLGCRSGVLFFPFWAPLRSSRLRSPPPFGAAAPFFMLVAAGIIFAFLYTWRKEAQRKFFKLPFDLSWNIWTFLSVAYLFLWCARAWLGSQSISGQSRSCAFNCHVQLGLQHCRGLCGNFAVRRVHAAPKAKIVWCCGYCPK